MGRVRLFIDSMLRDRWRKEDVYVFWISEISVGWNCESRG
jgi:hypothetical protein